MRGPDAVMVPSLLTMNWSTEGRESLHFASLGIKTSNTQKLGMIELVPFGRSVVSPRVKRWLCFCFKNSRNYLLINMLCVHPVQAETEARSRRQQMNWCEGKLGLILLSLASYFPYTLNKRKTRTFCSLWEPWGQPVTQEAGSVPESPRLWVGGKPSTSFSPPSPVIASMHRTSTEDQTLGLAEQV